MRRTFTTLTHPQSVSLTLKESPFPLHFKLRDECMVGAGAPNRGDGAWLGVEGGWGGEGVRGGRPAWCSAVLPVHSLVEGLTICRYVTDKLIANPSTSHAS